jgi:hypothetical protein
MSFSSLCILRRELVSVVEIAEKKQREGIFFPSTDSFTVSLQNCCYEKCESQYHKQRR